MDAQVAELQATLPAFEVLAPNRQTCPLVLASPHSGADYPANFQAQARLDPLTLRKSEDSFVDEIFASAPGLGVPLLRANFPRAFVDPNREPYELDPGMFDEPLPAYANTASPRVAAGLGTIARVVANGEPIYGGKLPVSEALNRIERYYRPYHAALTALVDETLDRFGVCVLVDCHSMPSTGGPMERDHGRNRTDIVLGDCHGVSCAETVIGTAERVLSACGYVVTRNVPYAGGFTTRYYGQPHRGVHTLQIEINRGLYMDERRIERTEGLERLAADMDLFVRALGRVDPPRLSRP